MTASLAALVVLATALDRLGVAYAIGGSVASSFHGEMRTTHDIDVLVELVPEKVSALVAALAPEFYVDETSVREALLRKRAFNVIHRSAAAKIDVFCSSGGSLDREQIERRTRVRLRPDLPEMDLTSAEVIVLRKLDWFRRGGEVSERQLGDVANVLREQRGLLDDAYLERQAADLGLTDLLRRALAAAG
jgi:hypothetical protein